MDALRHTRRFRGSGRSKLPAMPPRLSSCAAANATLSDEIMRHGPPFVRLAISEPSIGSEPQMTK
jgi:hypothetical protein